MAETTKDQIALVTGAASGLGKSLVTGLAKKGYQVIGADYNQQTGYRQRQPATADLNLR